MSKRSTEELANGEPAAAVPALPLLSLSAEVSLKVMSIMGEAYGALPGEFWGLSKAADLLAPRGFVVDKYSYTIYNRQTDAATATYTIVSVKIAWWDLNAPLLIMPGVKTVTIVSHDFNGELRLGEDVEEVLFAPDTRFNKRLELPAGLKKLAFGQGYSFPINLPAGLEELSFGYPYVGDFDQPITLPQSLKIAKFGRAFNQLLVLPPLLEELLLGDSYNQHIDLSGAPRLRVLHFGVYFRRHVELTESLETVKFGTNFVLPVVLPHSLRQVYFAENFDCPLVIPPRLEELVFHEYGGFNQHITFPEGSCMKVLRMSGRFDQPIHLVEGLETVFLGRDFNSVLTLPNSLRVLEFEYNSDFNQQIDLPTGLKSATFGACMKQRVTLPHTLEELKWFSDSPVDLSKGLQHVKFGPVFNQQLKLPLGLKSITIRRSYRLPLELPVGCERRY